jgi:hypothetical protein
MALPRRPLPAADKATQTKTLRKPANPKRREALLSVGQLVLTFGFLVLAGAFIAVQIGIWKGFIAILKDSRRRGWFK